MRRSTSAPTLRTIGSRSSPISSPAITGCAVEVAEGSTADERSYRVDFSKLRRTFPSLELDWDAARGARELVTAYRDHGLTWDDFDGDRYVRLRRLRHLLEQGPSTRSPLACRASGSTPSLRAGSPGRSSRLPGGSELALFRSEWSWPTFAGDRDALRSIHRRLASHLERRCVPHLPIAPPPVERLEAPPSPRPVSANCRVAVVHLRSQLCHRLPSELARHPCSNVQIHP